MTDDDEKKEGFHFEIFLTEEQSKLLRLHAAMRNRHPCELFCEILDVLLEDDMVAVVLDDELTQEVTFH